jgi:hypothetical protein
MFLYFKRFLEAWKRPEVWAVVKALGSRIVTSKNSRKKVSGTGTCARVRLCEGEAGRFREGVLVCGF